MLKIVRYVCALLFLVNQALFSRDVLLEFKAAYFWPQDSCVRSIYGDRGALYGPEVTFKLSKDSHWYGFASIDFLNKEGRSVGLCEFTKMSILPIGLGVKYFAPFSYGDVYVGLGFQPTHLKTVNCSPFVDQTTSKWGFGGIAKIGSYFNLSHNCFLDVFLDYSFVKLECSNCSAAVVPLKVNLSGIIFGAGIGYRFN